MKFKFFTTISFVCLAIMLTLVGIWAVTDLDFAVGGDITYTAPKPQINLQQDSKGFYVEMGTYNNAPVVWRLVGHNGAKFTDTTAPTSGIGTFVLETYVELKSQFGITNDYATSTIRTYLNGDYITKLNLANDETYNAITERSVADMYTNIGWNYAGWNSNYAKNAVYSLPTTNTESDKLWLMSVAEVYTLLGGGTITNGTISGDWSSVMVATNWDADSFRDDYLLRSPESDDSLNVAGILSDGDFDFDGVAIPGDIRPAFNIVF